MSTFIKLAVISGMFIFGSNIWLKYDTEAFQAGTRTVAPLWSGVSFIASIIVFAISIIGIIWSM